MFLYEFLLQVKVLVFSGLRIMWIVCLAMYFRNVQLLIAFTG